MIITIINIEKIKQHTFIPIEEIKKETPENTIIFSNDEMELKSDILDGEKLVMSKFDQEFIKVDDNKKQFKENSEIKRCKSI